MSMLSRFGITSEPTYADIQVVASGSALGGTATGITFADIAPDDVVLMFVAYTNTGSNTHTIPSGYVEGGNATLNGTTTLYRYAWYYKVMGDNLDAGINLNDSNADGSGFVYYVCRNVDTSNPILTSATNAPGAVAQANPPSVTTTIKSVIFAAVFGGNGATAAWTAAPTGYTGFLTVDATANADADAAAAYKAVSTGTTEDPGTFTLSGTFAGYAAITLALRPAPSIGGNNLLPTFISSSANTAGATSVTVAAPAGIQDGDLLVAIGITAGNFITAVPSGFKVISNQRTQNLFIATKVASAESGTYTFTQSSGTSFGLTMLVYRNATVVNTVGTANQVSGATATAPSIVPGYRGVLCAGFFAAGSRTVTTPPAGMTQRSLLSSSVYSMALYDESPVEANIFTGNNQLTWSSTATIGGIHFLVSNESLISPTFIGVANAQNAGLGTSLSLPKPASTAAGDLMLAFTLQSGGTTAGWTGPADWTEIYDSSVIGGAAARPTGAIYYKVANTSEGSSYTFTSVTSRTLAGCILTYRGAGENTVGTLASAANPLVPSANSMMSQSILIALASIDAASNTIANNISMTTRLTENGATAPSYIVCDQVVPRGPLGIRDFTVGTTTTVNAIEVVIGPTGVY